METFGLEQYFLVFLGVAIYILVDMNKLVVKQQHRKKLTWAKWQKYNLLPTITSIVISLALVYMFRDMFELHLLPPGWRNIICVGLGYNADSTFKSLMKRSSDEILSVTGTATTPKPDSDK